MPSDHFKTGSKWISLLVFELERFMWCLRAKMSHSNVRIFQYVLGCNSRTVWPGQKNLVPKCSSDHLQQDRIKRYFECYIWAHNWKNAQNQTYPLILLLMTCVPKDFSIRYSGHCPSPTLSVKVQLCQVIYIKLLTFSCLKLTIKFSIKTVYIHVSNYIT